MAFWMKGEMESWTSKVKMVHLQIVKEELNTHGRQIFTLMEHSG